MDQGSRPARIYLTPTGGLANRLMALVSCLRLADLFGREVHVEWQDTYVMKCELADIFGRPPKEWGPADDLSHIPDANRFYATSDAISEGKQPPWLDLKNIEGDVNVISNCFLGHADEGRGTTFHNYTASVADVGKYFDRLGVSASVATILAEIEARHGDLGDAVGLHVRRGPFDAVEKGYFGLVTDDDYLRLADHLGPTRRILLATDLDAVRDRFAAALGDRLVSYRPRSLQRDEDPRAIQDALVEMILLSRCRMVAGIAWSTFSYFATQIRCIPYIEVIPPGGGGPDDKITYQEHRYLDDHGAYAYRREMHVVDR